MGNEEQHMSDNRWLTPEERKQLRPHYDDLHSDPPQLHDLLDHAELCDEIIAELATALRDASNKYARRVGPARFEALPWEVALKRVDALTKDNT